MTGKDNKRQLLKTKDCYRKSDSVPVDRNPKQLWIGKIHSINRLAFQIARRADSNREEAVEVVALGEQIVKAVKIVEFLKRTVLDLHVSVDVISLKFKDTYKPLYEGLNEVTSESQRSAFLARFSFNPKGITNTLGHQAVTYKPSKVDSDGFLEKARNFNPNQRKSRGENRSKSQRRPRQDQSKGNKRE